MKKIVTFLKEAQIEIKKVIWPTRSEAINHTLAVVFISLGVAAFLGALDFVFTFILDNFVL